MQKLGLEEDAECTGSDRFEEYPDVGFWRRQFKPKATRTQYKFDWLFGVILPVLCVMADPIIFDSWLKNEEALLWMFKPFAYLLSFISIMAMMAWLIWGDKLKGVSAAISGLFFAGSLVSLGVGILISPLSVIGILFVGIGLLGFVPIISAFIYLRNATRAFRSAKFLLEKRVLIGSAVLSALFSVVIPWAVNVEIDAHRPYHEQFFRSFRGV
jgi:hypothetical protein